MENQAVSWRQCSVWEDFTVLAAMTSQIFPVNLLPALAPVVTGSGSSLWSQGLSPNLSLGAVRSSCFSWMEKVRWGRKAETNTTFNWIVRKGERRTEISSPLAQSAWHPTPRDSAWPLVDFEMYNLLEGYFSKKIKGITWRNKKQTGQVEKSEQHCSPTALYKYS